MRAVVPVREGVLPIGGTETIAECGGDAILIGSDLHAAVDELHGIAHTVTLITMPFFAPAAWAAALGEVVDASTSVVLPASPDGRDLAPRLAAALNRPLYAGAVAVTNECVSMVRYGGLALEDVHPIEVFVATLQPGVRGVERALSAAAVVTELKPCLVTDLVDVTVIEVLAPDAATMDLSESKRIVGGGAGLASAAAFTQLSELAVQLNASMGATRVITDRAWVGHERQIGTTGVVVNPQLYLAFGISGAVQHTSGLGEPDHIISINTDPHCPMMHLADLAIVSDANEVLQQLLAKLGEHV